MYNTILSIYGYGILKDNDMKENEDFINDIKKDLTMRPNVNFVLTEEQKEFIIYNESKTRIYVPRFYGLQKFGLPDKPIIDESKECNNLIFKGNLREQQLEPVTNFIKAAENPLKLGGIISVPCGFGKTIMSVYIACHFKKKTLFISHKDFLNQQFKSTVEEFVPTATIGKIKQSKVDVDKDIVIASLQSLAIRDYDSNIFKEFGLIIIDEVHHLGAEVFSRALSKINATAKILGLSATLNRKDGMRKVFEYFIGKSVYKYVKKDDIIMNVQIHKYYTPDIEYSANKLLWNGKPNIASMINNITAYEPRNVYIIEILKQILKEDPERKVLILSERRNQLTQIEKYIDEMQLTVGYYVGGLSQAILDVSATKQIILATYQMAAEGMNIPTLNTLILASPISDIQQSVGRILREKPNERKYIPLCIDILDEFSVFTKKGYVRIKYYKSQNYNINYYINHSLLEPDKEIKYEFIPDDD